MFSKVPVVKCDCVKCNRIAQPYFDLCMDMVLEHSENPAAQLTELFFCEAHPDLFLPSNHKRRGKRPGGSVLTERILALLRREYPLNAYEMAERLDFSAKYVVSRCRLLVYEGRLKTFKKNRILYYFLP